MPYVDETKIAEIQEHADDVLKAFHKSALRSVDGETENSYRKRLAARIQQHAHSMKDINLREATGSAFDLIEKQIYDEARREAARPSNIPAGEMREMRKFDATGGPFYEWHGHPSNWMDQFTNGAKKRLVGIRTETQRGYIPNR
jgi:hypothetical protein